jgi:hypothetical protein
VDVVLHAADLVNKNPLFMADAGEISPCSGLLLFWNEFEAVFCAEDDVNRVQNQSVRQLFFPQWRNILLTSTLICVAPEGA